MKPDRKLVRDTLKNWVAWSRDRERDSAEKGYGSISSPFHLVIPTSKGLKLHDDAAAELVEEVFRELHKWKPRARALLRAYYLRDELFSGRERTVIDKKTMSPVVVGEVQSMSDDDLARRLGISTKHLGRLLGDAQDAYAKLWAEMYWDDFSEKICG